ncbi:MAG: alkaline phosphatase family protein [Acidimicrobiales bacterium]|nr:alkaline phosphatase family protein [Acidimicrobiales bacterium]
MDHSVGEATTPVVPAYHDACVTALVPALLEGSAAPTWLPAKVLQARQILLLVLDGLGWLQLRDRTEVAPTLTDMAGGPITTVAPSTTAAALTSISTGLPPGEHGVVGYRIAVGGSSGPPHGEILNALRWSTGNGDARRRHDPRLFQPCEMFGSQRPPVVTRAQFADSGFTAAHLSDTRLFGYADRVGLVDQVLGAFAREEPFVYAYWDDIDRTAHEFGLAERYNDELAACDAMVAELLHRLPAGTAVVVTADHGQVHVGERLIHLPAEVTGLVDGQSGEARFRWLHSRPGAASDLLAAAHQAFDHVGWVRSVDEVVSAGWLGDRVTSTARGRLGDVAVVARDPVAFVDPAEVSSIELIGRHGSLTAAEMLVPAVFALT